jgi:hypothetical protein
MEKTIRIADTELPLSLYDATVIHANKYTETSGGAFNFPVSSTLYTDMVFRLRDTDQDCQVYSRNRNLPVYTGQEVSVITAGDTIIGYVDRQTNYYYFITGDPAGILKMGIPRLIVWLFGIVGGVFIYFLNDNPSLWLLAPLALAYAVYFIQKWILNQRIRKAVDSFLE